MSRGSPDLGQAIAEGKLRIGDFGTLHERGRGFVVGREAEGGLEQGERGTRRRARVIGQLDQELTAPDVSAVENMIDFTKDLEHPRPQHAVRVRDDAESHWPVVAPIARDVT